MNKNNPYTVKEIKEWGEAKKLFQILSTSWVFRGHQKAKWPLESSLDRINLSHSSSTKEDIERFFILQFQRKAHNYLDASLLPRDDLEWLALMQHHGAPTRLLDFTKSPYVASFFALENAGGPSAVWAINKDWCSRQAKMKVTEQCEEITEEILEDPALLTMWFGKIFFELDIPMVCPVEPFRMNERLTVQQGCFLCPGKGESTFEKNLMSLSRSADDIPRNVWKIVFYPSVRREALTDLYLMNVNRATLFPGIDGFAQSLKHETFSSDVEQLIRITIKNWGKRKWQELRCKFSGGTGADT